MEQYYDQAYLAVCSPTLLDDVFYPRQGINFLSPSVLLDYLSSKGIIVLNKVFSLDNDPKQIRMVLGKHS